MNIPEDNSETWQVEFAGDVHDVSFEEMTEWIARGELLRIDRVKKGNLRWIEAGKVPALTEFFNAKDLETFPETVVTTSSGRANVEVLGPQSISTPSAPGSVSPVGAFSRDPLNASAAGSDAHADMCAVHTDAPAAYICDTCCNAFCKACPNGYGAAVKICPFCGAMCKSLAEIAQAEEETRVQHVMSTEGFGFSDFFSALAYPFRYPASLIFGALMFAFFSVGQGAASFGGAFMLAAAIMCFMCANMLSFGVLANVVENFTQGKIGGNFMPSFDDFNIWDDVVHPFFLSIGVYISSFAPLAAVFIAAIFLISGATKPAANPAAAAIDPQLLYSANAVKQSEEVKNLIAQQNANAQARTKQMSDISRAAETGQPTPSAPPAGASVPSAVAGQQSTAGQPLPPAAQQEEERFQKLNDQIAQARKAQLEGAIGKTPETTAQEQKAILAKVLAYGSLFLICAGLALLWGLFYLPAACCVAGYTRSFTATLNPTVGLDTIKRLGVDYAKVLGMGLIIAVMSLTVSGILAIIFEAFALPGVGNVPAKFLSSIVAFYLSVAFSCTLGFALYKAGDRLQLYKA